MKKIIAALLFIGLIPDFQVAYAQEKPGQEELRGTVAISGAWALYPMAVKWAEEFQKLYPGIKIDIAAGGAGKGMADALAGLVDIGMVSRDINATENKKGALGFAVTKDAVVPTINADNPFLNGLLAKGLTRDAFIAIWITGEVSDWKYVTDTSAAGAAKTELHVYTRSDACGAAETWAKFLGKQQEDLIGVGVYGDPGLAEAVSKDIFGIGYNNINYVYDATTKTQLKGLRVLPIDINGDGDITSDEDFYGDRDQIVVAIAQGRYPSPPARELYFVTKGRPQAKTAQAFIQWVLTDGQKYVSECGYINLTDEKIKEQLGKLDGK